MDVMVDLVVAVDVDVLLSKQKSYLDVGSVRIDFLKSIRSTFVIRLVHFIYVKIE